MVEIILVQPQLAENIGMTARAMMNCGLYHLRLVNPREDHLSEKALSASSGADEILHNAKVYKNTADAIKDLSQIFATTARHRDQIKLCHTADEAAKKMNDKTGILFGPERTGLHNDDIALADAIITIPLNPKHCSLNLSQAVLLVGYEWHKQQNNHLKTKLITNKTKVADKRKLIDFFETLEKELDDCGNFKSDEKRPRMVRNLRNIFNRCQMTEQEINTFLGIISHLKK